MKKVLLIVAIILLVGGGYYFWQKYRPANLDYNNAECRTDNECKILYNNCSCDAVPTSDTRTKLSDEGVYCIVNECNTPIKNVGAVCTDGQCARDDGKQYIPFE